MATDKITVRLGWRWWVKPYLGAIRIFIFSFGWAIDDDDLREWLAHEMSFIARRGIRADIVT